MNQLEKVVRHLAPDRPAASSVEDHLLDCDNIGPHRVGSPAASTPPPPQLLLAQIRHISVDVRRFPSQSVPQVNGLIVQKSAAFP